MICRIEFPVRNQYGDGKPREEACVVFIVWKKTVADADFENTQKTEGVDLRHIEHPDPEMRKNIQPRNWAVDYKVYGEEFTHVYYLYVRRRDYARAKQAAYGK